ncbi:DNA-binding response regulator [Chitinophagaceae bacterium IBVUCB2]|nr:DNA-binding response regulator [Chitinophagaceae bacterium IBVUCB2]
MKILVIEDEPAMRETMVQSLQQEQYVVEFAADFYSAQEKIGIYEYDCILLDIGLPGGNGLTLLKELKKENKAEAVIIVSAKNSLEDKVKGLDLGADDYLAKPFHLAELHARVKSVLRRKKLDGNSLISINNLKIDTGLRTVWVDEKDLPLNRKEYDVLLYLITNKNRLVNKSALAEHVWGDYIDEANSFDFIYSQIKNLRKKLKDSEAAIEIQAIYGVGYKLTGE